MEIQLTLKDVPVGEGTGCELTVNIDGELPEIGMLADMPSVAFLIAIQSLHKSGRYLDIAATVLATGTSENHDEHPDKG
jgi:hypothetical protein